MKRPAKSGPAQLVELVLVVAVAIGLALGIQAFLVKPYRIPSESMVPTLVVGQRVLVNRIGNNFGDPKIGDILVFHPPVGAESQDCGARRAPGAACDKPNDRKASVNYIKRVVGLPGDKLSIRDGHVVRNGKLQKESFIAPCDGSGDCDFPTTITVPADHYFMMGDNRGASDDSRYWGPVPRDWIIGSAFATYWPPKRINIF
ncbi:MAG TPA: signal peptidase I [Baekduia sp.]|nr:signal peptidase I [Baekduia sp.]